MCGLFSKLFYTLLLARCLKSFDYEIPQMFRECTLVLLVAKQSDFKNIQTVFPKRFPAIQNSRNVQIWTEFANISILHWTLLSRLRFSGHCSVLISDISSEFSSNRIESHISLFAPNNSTLEQPLNIRHFSPDYVLLFVSNKNNHNISRYQVLVPNFLDSSRLIFLEREHMKNIFIGCYTCTKHNTKDLDMTVPEIKRLAVLVNILELPRTLKLLENSWNSLHKQINEFGWQLTSKSADDDDHICYKSTVILNVRSDFMSPYMEQTCALVLFSEIQNCTSQECNSYLTATFSYNEILYQDMYGEMTDIALAHGAQFEGLKFTVILGQNENKIESADFAMLQPFSMRSWVSILTCFIILCVVSSIYGFKFQESWFWSYSTLLGIEYNLQGKYNRHTAFIILIWIFTCMLLRNLYTSSIYSYLTSTPEPKNVPETWKQLFDNSESTLILAESLLSLQLHLQYENLKDSMLENNTHVTNLLRSLIVVDTEPSPSNFTYNISRLVPLACASFYNRFNMMIATDRMCDISKRIAFVYNAIGFRQEYSLRMMYPLLRIIAGRKIVKNVNEPVWFSTPMVWFASRKMFYLNSFQRTVSSVVESGLFTHFKKTYETGVEIGLLNKVKKVLGVNVSSFRFAAEVFEGGSGWENKDIDGFTRASVEDLGAVFKVFLYSVGMCITAWFVEVLWAPGD